VGKRENKTDDQSPRWLIPVLVVVLLAVLGVIAAKVILDRPAPSPPTAVVPAAEDQSNVDNAMAVPEPPVQDPQAPPVGIAVGDTAPNFTLPDLAGKSVSLSQFRGKVVILDFWASWCAPCRASMPSLESLYDSVKGDGVVMLGVSLDRSESDAVTFLKQNGYTEMIALYGSLSSAEGVASRYGVYGIPHTFIIDREGIIRFSNHPMYLTASLLNSIL
jgi:peroxiredoxin